MSRDHGLLLDTNVVSELSRDVPEPAVLRWLTRLDPELLHLSVITLGELAHGVTRMAAGLRRSRLDNWLRRELKHQFANRILEFGESEAMAWGELRTRTERQGSPCPTVDLQIAATAAHAGLALATRNTRDFEGLGVELVDPWHGR